MRLAALVPHHPGDGPVGLEVLGLPTDAEEGGHELGPEPLPEGMFGGQRPQLRDQRGILAEVCVDGDAEFEGVQAQLGEGRDIELLERLGRDADAHGAAPQAERLAQETPFGLGVPRQSAGTSSTAIRMLTSLTMVLLSA
nr:hypothetical protein [Nonomuraea fuscirosea]